MHRVHNPFNFVNEKIFFKFFKKSFLKFKPKKNLFKAWRSSSSSWKMVIVLSFCWDCIGDSLGVAVAETGDSCVHRISIIGVHVHRAREPAGAGSGPLVDCDAGLCDPAMFNVPDDPEKKLCFQSMSTMVSRTASN